MFIRNVNKNSEHLLGIDFVIDIVCTFHYSTREEEQLFTLEAPERVSRGKVGYTDSQMTRRVCVCVCVFWGRGECRNLGNKSDRRNICKSRTQRKIKA